MPKKLFGELHEAVQAMEMFDLLRWTCANVESARSALNHKFCDKESPFQLHLYLYPAEIVVVKLPRRSCAKEVK